jgi:hypothetical protein
MKLTIAIASDLHFFSTAPSTTRDPSWLGLENNGTPPKYQRPSNPWSSLTELLEREELRADLLVSPGDITTHADQNGLSVAWFNLIDLGKRLNAHLVAVATGNHDVCSRPNDVSTNPIRQLNEPTDLFENLKLLDPEYPLHHLSNYDSKVAHAQRLHYFGSDYTLVDDHTDYRLIVLNSCGRHTTTPTEYERGRIASSTRLWLGKQLKQMDWKQRKLNLLVCHHHPLLHEDNHSGSYDFMKDGSLLLKDLSEFGDWVIFHGHKHHGKLSYAPGSSSPPVVFAASSFGALLEDAGNSMRNQFYIIDLELDPNGGAPKGTIRAWNWFIGQGWQRANSTNDGIFYGCGFGEKRHPDEIADEIKSNVTIPADWSTVKENVSCLNHVTPSDLLKIGKSLEQRHSICILKDDAGVITQVARTP